MGDRMAYRRVMRLALQTFIALAFAVVLAGCAASGEAQSLATVRAESAPVADEIATASPRNADGAASQTSETASLDADEVVTVVEKRVETMASRRDIYRRVAKAKTLFAHKQVKEALPLLLDTAQRGFKDSQARVGHIYLQGLGEVERDPVQGVGWLGVASHGTTSPGIKNYFNDIWKRIPDAYVPYFEEVVDEYRSKYGENATGVVCGLNRPLRSFVKELSCYFEAPLPEEISLLLEEHQDNEAMMDLYEERMNQAREAMENEACRNPTFGGAGVGCQ